jgi:hypothetical protein
LNDFKLIPAALLCLITFSSAEEICNWGPFYRCIRQKEKAHTSILGPIIERNYISKSKNRLNAVRPLISTFGDDTKRENEGDLLWPVGTKRVGEDQKKYRFTLLGNTQQIDPLNGNGRIYESYWLFPLIWQKWEKDTENSFVFIPFYGEINSCFAFDKANFVMWPLWAKSRRKDVVSHDYIWPLFNSSEGEKVRRYRFWPFYCYSRRDHIGINRSYLWPFIHTNESLNPQVEGSGYFIFPFYGSTSYINKRAFKEDYSKTILWPFYTHYAAKYEQSPERDSYRTTFWPIYQDWKNDEGQDSYKNYIWPFYGIKERKDYKRTFILWPFWQTYITSGDRQIIEKNLFPFYRYYMKENDSGKMEEEKRVYWPFYRKAYKGGETYSSAPALFPFHIEEITRNYSPLWSLYRKWEGEDYAHFELLWGFYYNYKSPVRKHWSLFPFIEVDETEKDESFSILKGLFGKRKTKDENFYRILWLPEF